VLATTTELPAEGDRGAAFNRAPLALVLVVFGIASMAVISLARVLLS